LSILQKKRGDLSEAIRLWELAAEQGHLYAFIELAKHYEHKMRDMESALKWTGLALKQVKAIDLPAYARQFWIAEIGHRMERLKRKAGI
jgi:TPR repeat protein